MKQQHFSPFLCAAAFALAVTSCSDSADTPNPSTAAGAGGATGGTPGTTAGTTGAAGTAAAGTTAVAGRTGAAGTGTVTAGTGTGAAGAATAGTGAAGTAAAGTGAAAGASGAAAGGGGAAAGSGATAGAGGATGGMLGGALAYTGPFTMGMTIDPKYKCPMVAAFLGGGTGENKSPPLAWKGGPADTKSFAVVLYDTQYSMLHWAIWDIPATVNTLAEGLPSGYELTSPMGAHQAANMGTDKHAYYGPCSSGASAGTYEYRIYALKVDKLGLMESTAATQAQTAIEGMMLEKAVWSGKPM